MLAGFAVSPASAANPVPFPWLVDSASLAGPTLIEGETRDSNGRAIAAQVTLLAMPSADVYAAMPENSAAKVLPVGRAHSDAKGHFALRIDPASPIGEFASASGLVNYTIMARDGARTTWFAFSAPEGAVSARAVEAGSAAVDSSRGLEAAVPDAALTFGAAQAGGGTPYGAVPQPLEKVGCSEALVSTYAATWDSVAELYTGGHTNVDFEYTSGAESTLGVAYSSTGTYGTWSQSGSQTAGSTATINFAKILTYGKVVERTKFEDGKYYMQCVLSGGQISSTYVTHVKRFIGGSTLYNAASWPSGNDCDQYQNGDQVTIDQHNAVTWTNALSIAGAIGIDLSSRTGFKTNAKQHWYFVNGGGYICGTNDSPFYAVTIVGT